MPHYRIDAVRYSPYRQEIPILTTSDNFASTFMKIGKNVFKREIKQILFEILDFYIDLLVMSKKLKLNLFSSWYVFINN